MPGAKSLSHTSSLHSTSSPPLTDPLTYRRACPYLALCLSHGLQAQQRAQLFAVVPYSYWQSSTSIALECIPDQDLSWSEDNNPC
jgi:hypothetical protein